MNNIMFYSIVFLFIHILYTSCNKPSNLRSNIHPCEQESNHSMDVNPYRENTVPVSIRAWWNLLREMGLFDKHEQPLYGTKISSIHAFLTAFGNENFPCVGNGIHRYYALVKALKNTENKTFLKKELQEMILVVSLIDRLKQQFSPSCELWKHKSEEIDRLNQQVSTGNKSHAPKLGNDRHLMLKRNAANTFIEDVHLKMIALIIHQINDSKNPNGTINGLGLDHMINLMRMLSSYSASSEKNADSVQNLDLDLNFNKFIRLITDKIDSETFSCHRVETWLKIFKILNLDQRIGLSDIHNPKESIIKLYIKFITWAVDQSNAMLFASTPRSNWDFLIQNNIIITLHKRIVNYYEPRDSTSESKEGPITSIDQNRVQSYQESKKPLKDMITFKNWPHFQNYYNRRSCTSYKDRLTCPRCWASDIFKNGNIVIKGKHHQRYKCKGCRLSGYKEKFKIRSHHANGKCVINR